MTPGLSSKLTGLLSMVGTILGLVLGGATIEYNILVSAGFFLLALISLAIFAAFLYYFLKYAQYEMPLENVLDDEEN
jgi:uncharacterized membrane protein YesL